MTICDALQGINAYPIPLRTLEQVAERRGLQLSADCDMHTLQHRDLKLALADLLIWLSLAPQVAQGGQSYSFTDEQREQFKCRANEIYDELNVSQQVSFGYKGSLL